MALLDYKMQAAEALKLTGDDMKGLGLVDDIVPEPLGGAHAREETFATVNHFSSKSSTNFKNKTPTSGSTPYQFSNMGVVAG